MKIMNNSLKTAEQTIQSHKLIIDGERVLAALSGGSDSVAMLHILVTLSKKYGFFVSAAHVNHNIRAEAERDEKFAEGLCKELGVPFFSKSVDVRAYARSKGMSEETAGRELRYAFFDELCEKYGFDKIATAHNRNDNAETVLMHFVRGSGLDGLGGIPQARGRLIRPVINLTKADIIDYCKQNSLEYVTDKSNFETVYTRNRFRLGLIPYIEREFNPGFVNTVTSNAALLKEDAEYLNHAARLEYDCIKTDRGLPVSELRELPLPLKRRVITLLYKDFSGRVPNLPGVYIDMLLRLIEANVSGSSANILSGVSAKIEYGFFELFHTAASAEGYDYEAAVGLPITIEECGAQLVITKADKFGKNTQNEIFFALSAPPSLHIRNRRNGDVFFPSGMNGRKKLSDYFIDKKLPREKRNSLPLLLNGDDIVWVIGCRADRRFAEGTDIYKAEIKYF